MQCDENNTKEWIWRRESYITETEKWKAMNEYWIVINEKWKAINEWGRVPLFIKSFAK